MSITLFAGSSLNTAKEQTNVNFLILLIEMYEVLSLK